MTTKNVKVACPSCGELYTTYYRERHGYKLEELVGDCEVCKLKREVALLETRVRLSEVKLNEIYQRLLRNDGG